jgi:hypothetical protein
MDVTVAANPPDVNAAGESPAGPDRAMELTLTPKSFKKTNHSPGISFNVT